MHAVDTNVLVRALVGDDPSQSPRAVAFIRACGSAWVSQVVLVETLWVLESAYDQGKPQLVEVLSRLLDNRELALEDPAVVQAALDLYRSSRKLDFSDCLILEIARRAGHVPLATFDQALGKAEGTCLVD